jgi:hypothetical protein
LTKTYRKTDHEQLHKKKEEKEGKKLAKKWFLKRVIEWLSGCGILASSRPFFFASRRR